MNKQDLVGFSREQHEKAVAMFLKGKKPQEKSRMAKRSNRNLNNKLYRG